MRLREGAMALAMLVSCVAVAEPAWGQPIDGATWAKQVAAYEEQSGLLTLYVDRKANRVFARLPAADEEGIALRVIHHMVIRDGTGSPATQMERGRLVPSRILHFRRLGQKVIAEYENPGFRGSASVAEERGVHESFPTSMVWSGDVLAKLSDGSAIVDLSGFFARDGWGLLARLNRSNQGSFHAVQERTMVDAASAVAHADNVEAEASFTFAAEKPGDEISRVSPDPQAMTLRLHHSFLRLPDDGYKPRVFDPRYGGFDTLISDFSAPIGQPLVTRLANRFRLEKTDPQAARSRVVKPIVFYVDNTAPPIIQQALREGASWWADAFDAAGFIDAFRVEILPEDADPFDSRYNVILWSHRLTRGWAYGHTAVDPRTGEVLRGVVLLGSQRTRQNLIMFEGLLGTAQSGRGGPNDPVEIALARLRQLVAHETGHVLGFEHNFASHWQGRASVSDYPMARVAIAGSDFDMSDAYDAGLGSWDFASAYALYSQDDPATLARKTDEAFEHFTYRGQPEGRAVTTLTPSAAPWVNGTDPVAELAHIMDVRRIALAKFGLGNLLPDMAVHDLRRRLVPVYLYHRYQAEATARLIGGADYGYPLAGHGDEALLSPVPAARQEAAAEALLATLRPQELVLRPDLPAMLAAQNSGIADPQNDIELFSSRMSRSFDAGAAAEAAADIVLGAMLQPERLNALVDSAARDPDPFTLDDLLDLMFARLFDGSPRDPTKAEMARRVQARSVFMLGRRLYGVNPVPVSGAVPLNPPAALAPTTAAILAARLEEWGERLARSKSADPIQRAHDLWLAKLLTDEDKMRETLRSGRFDVRIPPGAPI